MATGTRNGSGWNRPESAAILRAWRWATTPAATDADSDTSGCRSITVAFRKIGKEAARKASAASSSSSRSSHTTCSAQTRSRSFSNSRIFVRSVFMRPRRSRTAFSKVNPGLQLSPFFAQGALAEAFEGFEIGHLHGIRLQHAAFNGLDATPGSSGSPRPHGRDRRG